MSLLTTLNNDIKTTMKVRDKEIPAVLRILKTAVQDDQIKTSRELNGEEELTVLSREVKQRKDSLLELEKAGRDDLVEKVKAEIATIGRYMPQQLMEEKIHQLVQEIITQAGATSPKDFGKVMGIMIPEVKGKADGNQINAIVKGLLRES